MVNWVASWFLRIFTSMRASVSVSLKGWKFSKVSLQLSLVHRMTMELTFEKFLLQIEVYNVYIVCDVYMTVPRTCTSCIHDISITWRTLFHELNAQRVMTHVILVSCIHDVCMCGTVIYTSHTIYKSCIHDIRNVYDVHMTYIYWVVFWLYHIYIRHVYMILVLHEEPYFTNSMLKESSYEKRPM